ncbi:hypothetical protein RCC89_02055 [Cytophagaceae bacterium ABcell3]|nr:hypothetical protein RCC89_02055 [Cytophagaceae bacterium ABcell3]
MDKIKDEKIRFSGGIGYNHNLYLATGTDDRFNPFSNVVTGNVTASGYGFTVPVSFAYTNQQFSHQLQPFNIIGLSPSYKNLTVHAGYRNLTFSPYTLSGHNFLGGGVEWNRNKFFISAMGGRLMRASEGIEERGILPVYDRYGGGIKAGLRDGGDEISFITFYARDMPESIFSPSVFSGVRPMENQVYSIILKKSIAEDVAVHFEGAASAITHDTREVSPMAASGIGSLYFMPVTDNTEFYRAFNTGITFGINNGSFGVNFERVEPDFRTLGAYFFNSDFQNITGNFSKTLFKNKMSLSLTGGFQRDDLYNENMSRMNRFVGSANVSMNFSERFSASGSFSNFNSFTNVRPVDEVFLQTTEFDRLDTMNFVQLSQNMNLNMNYKVIENSRLIHNMHGGVNHNQISNTMGLTRIANGMTAAFGGYNISWKESGLSVGANLNANRNTYEAGNAYFAGGGLNLGAAFFKKKLRANWVTNLSNNYEGRNLTANLVSIINSYSLKVGKFQSLALNMRYTGRRAVADAQHTFYNTSFHEFMGTVGYNLSF